MELMLFDETKFNQAVKLAATLAKSTIVPKHFQGRAEDVFACLVLGAELGFQPMQSLQAIVMISGQCTLKAQTQLALVRSRCPKAIIQIEVDEEKKIATCFARRDENDPGYKSTWDMNKAKAMGLSSRDQWLKQPTTMARWRSVSEALRVVFPDVLQGIYATEELEDIPVQEKSIVQVLNEAADEDFPIPLEEKTVGPLYRVMNAKYRGKQLYQIPLDELTEYSQALKVRTTAKKAWENELISVIDSYVANIDSFRPMILDLMSEEK